MTRCLSPRALPLACGIPTCPTNTLVSRAASGIRLENEIFADESMSSTACRTVVVGAALATACHLVGVVIALCPLDQVVGVHARGVVTGVTRDALHWATELLSQDRSVSKTGAVHRLRQYAVTLLVQRPAPLDAGCLPSHGQLTPLSRRRRRMDSTRASARPSGSDASMISTPMRHSGPQTCGSSTASSD